MVSCHMKEHGVAFSCQSLMCSKERMREIKKLTLELLKTWKVDEDHIIYVIHHNRIYLDRGKFIADVMDF